MEGSSQTTPIDAEYEEVGEPRSEHAQAPRRSAPVKLDPLFAATLVNQLAKPEEARLDSYVAPTLKPRCGIVVNVKA